MENSVHKISQALLHLASFSDAVIQVTPKARTALKNSTLESAQRSLLERIDGFRSLDQLLAISGDLIAVHAALGKLMAAGLVTTDSQAEANVPVSIGARVPPVGANIAPPPAPSPVAELENAKRLLLLEAKLLLGKGSEKLRSRIEACRSIEDVYDLIVKFQHHLATTGKANPDVFLDRLAKGLATARHKTSAGQRASLQ